MIKEYYKIAADLGLTRAPESIEYSVNTLFSGINFNAKRVLDVGGGTGIYSFFAYAKGAKEVINLEPVLDGSNTKMIKTFHTFRERLGAFNVEIINNTFQDFESKSKFDVIILHSSINHLNEDACRNLHNNNESERKYLKLLTKLYNITNADGKVVISDCTRYNFWPLLKLKNPFAPSIDWEIHQSPKTWKYLLENVGFYVERINWPTYRRLGWFGKTIFGNSTASYFLSGHFNMYLFRE
jgi:SAM-dependent methyltransferase